MIDPQAVDDRKPRWETLREAQREGEHLTRERQGLLDYQEKLDLARDRLDKGTITERELETMKDELALSAPERVRRKLRPEDIAVTERSQQAAAVPADEMDALRRRTGLGPTAPAPG